MSLNRAGIYKIVNIVNGKMYIGSAVNLENRRAYHWISLRNNDKGRSSVKMRNAWNKYGEENFSFEVIEFVRDNDKLIEREQYWLDCYKTYERGTGYNTASIAGSAYGCKHSDATKKKIAESKMGNKHFGVGENHTSAKLTESDVWLIFWLLTDRNIRISQIADKFGVRESTIYYIRNGTSWGYLGASDDVIAIRDKRASNAKFSMGEVGHIKEKLHNGVSVKDIAMEYSVDPETIRRIKNGITYSQCG